VLPKSRGQQYRVRSDVRARLTRGLEAPLKLGLLPDTRPQLPKNYQKAAQFSSFRVPRSGIRDSHRIAKGGRVGPDIPILRYCRAMLRPLTLIVAGFFFDHRPLERSQRPEGVGKSAAQLLIDQPHPHWFNMLRG